MRDALVRSVHFKRDDIDPNVYPFSIPALRDLTELELDPHVTFLVGENGSGKSTLVEAIAVAAGLNPEGGSRHVKATTRASHSPLHRSVRLVRGIRRMRDGYFLRAESFFNVATYLDGLDGGNVPYGGKSLHEQSYGESFISLIKNRFGSDSFFVLDEPEAALSLRGQLALMRRMHDLVKEGSQFVSRPTRPCCSAIPMRRSICCRSAASARRVMKTAKCSSSRACSYRIEVNSFGISSRTMPSAGRCPIG